MPLATIPISPTPARSRSRGTMKGVSAGWMVLTAGATGGTPLRSSGSSTAGWTPLAALVSLSSRRSCPAWSQRGQRVSATPYCLPFSRATRLLLRLPCLPGLPPAGMRRLPARQLPPIGRTASAWPPTPSLLLHCWLRSRDSTLLRPALLRTGQEEQPVRRPMGQAALPGRTQRGRRHHRRHPLQRRMPPLLTTGSLCRSRMRGRLRPCRSSKRSNPGSKSPLLEQTSRHGSLKDRLRPCRRHSSRRAGSPALLLLSPGDPQARQRLSRHLRQWLGRSSSNMGGSCVSSSLLSSKCLALRSHQQDRHQRRPQACLSPARAQRAQRARQAARVDTLPLPRGSLQVGLRPLQGQRSTALSRLLQLMLAAAWL